MGRFDVWVSKWAGLMLECMRISLQPELIIACQEPRFTMVGLVLVLQSGPRT